MKKTWDTMNKITKIIILNLAIFFIFPSCSEQNILPMNKVKTENTSGFNLKTLDNNYMNLEELRGSYVLINFWATWCKPCVNEIPSLNNLHKQFKSNNNFKIVAINIGQNKDIVDKFVKNISPINFTVLLDENMDLTEWNVQAIPTTFLLSDKGKIIYKVEGEREWDSQEFISFINSIINK